MKIENITDNNIRSKTHIRFINDKSLVHNVGKLTFEKAYST